MDYDQQLALIIDPTQLIKKVSAASALDLPVPTWGNIKNYTARGFDFSVQASERTSPHESKAALTDYHVMYGGTGNNNFIFLGQ